MEASVFLSFTLLTNNFFLLNRKECVDCGCTRDSHQSSSDYGDLPYLKDMLLEDISPLDDKKKLDTKYAWYPSGIDYEMVRFVGSASYFTLLHCLSCSTIILAS